MKKIWKKCAVVAVVLVMIFSLTGCADKVMNYKITKEQFEEFRDKVSDNGLYQYADGITDKLVDIALEKIGEFDLKKFLKSLK